MNTPGFVFVDVFAEVVAEVLASLQLEEGAEVWPVLNYQYGYIKELNQKLVNWNTAPETSNLRFPLVYVAQPFQINKGLDNNFGVTQDLRVFVMNSSNKDWTAEERMVNNFKPILYKIYHQLLIEIDLHTAFVTQHDKLIRHGLIDRYYWGEQQKQVLDDVVDCLELRNLQLTVDNNYNCSKPFKNY